MKIARFFAVAVGHWRFSTRSQQNRAIFKAPRWAFPCAQKSLANGDFLCDSNGQSCMSLSAEILRYGHTQVCFENPGFPKGGFCEGGGGGNLNNWGRIQSGAPAQKTAKLIIATPVRRTHPNYWDFPPSQKAPFGNSRRTKRGSTKGVSMKMPNFPYFRANYTVVF